MEDNIKNDMGYDSGKLTSYIERVERLEEEKANLNADIREVFSEAKGEGYDVKALRQVIKLRKMLPADRAEYTYLTKEYSKLIGLEG